jgi:hypothetical protein
MTDEQRGFIQGAGMALAALVRDADQPTLAGEIMAQLEVTSATAAAAGLPEYDLAELRKAEAALPSANED